MVKIDIISGFLGAGKTTLIKKLLKEAFEGEQVVLIENEFGEVGIDHFFNKCCFSGSQKAGPPPARNPPRLRIGNDPWPFACARRGRRGTVFRLPRIAGN